jgi:AraC-like DNA-binding protein
MWSIFPSGNSSLCLLLLELKTHETLESPFSYRVVSDGCIDIFLELTRPEENFAMGFCKNYTEFSLGQQFHYAGIRFLPTVFPSFFRINATELSNRFRWLHEILPGTAEFIQREFSESSSSEQIVALFDEYLIQRISEADFDDDSRLYKAIDLILDHVGVINIETDIDTGISHRQLRRLFKYYIGDTPKAFSKVVRFQNILRQSPRPKA